jgi:hypothetical protein
MEPRKLAANAETSGHERPNGTDRMREKSRAHAGNARDAERALGSHRPIRESRRRRGKGMGEVRRRRPCLPAVSAKIPRSRERISSRSGTTTVPFRERTAKESNASGTSGTSGTIRTACGKSPISASTFDSAKTIEQATGAISAPNRPRHKIQKQSGLRSDVRAQNPRKEAISGPGRSHPPISEPFAVDTVVTS